VDTTEFVPRERAEAPNARPVVVLAARLLGTKGVREFVDAARRLRGTGVDARFVLVGEPDVGNPATIDPQSLADWVAEGVVEHWGFRGDMTAVYAQASIACLPSYTEGMPKSLIEAAACGLPIVTSNEAGCRAVVRDGDNGVLVPVRDSVALADALGRLLADAPLRARLGARGRERAVQEFSLHRVVRSHLELYETLAP
jgi:glycosyltransferase involved in cell wall biosynthesis